MAAACPRCGSAWLDAQYDLDAVKTIWQKGLSGRAPHLWRYGEMLPIPVRDPEVSMHEGFTPLIRLVQYERLYDHAPIFVKDERQGPTSSFKDRQAAMAVTALRQAGIRECVLASTGNAGAAYAAYCARAGIKLWLFLTHLVPGEKMREAALYGAEVVKVDGSYDEAKAVAAEFARRKGIHLDRGARAIPGKEAMKTLAFEIAEQLGLEFDHERGHWLSPDWYIQAVSGGIGPLGVWKGFSELFRMGLIDKMPRLGIIQAAGCAPMVEAYRQSASTVDPVTPQTLIHILATGDPGHAYVLLNEAVRSNHGTMLAVEDGETFAAMRRLASTAGLSVEPATAVAFAGVERMLYDGIISDDEIVVINCSGHTFPAESHVLGDQYLLSLQRVTTAAQDTNGLNEGLTTLDEQMTTILIVDDSPNERRLLRKYLKAKRAYRIFEAGSGKQALAMVQEHEPDLIVTDLMMPGMDGITLIEQVRWSPATRHIPIVVVSARSMGEADRAALSQYIDSIWLKGSFEMRQLVRHLIQIVEGSSGNNDPHRQGRPDRVSTDTLRPATSILLIDNESAFADHLSRMIGQSEPAIIYRANSTRDGLKLSYEHHPDVILLASSFDDMPAQVFVEALRRDSTLHHTPVILYAHHQMDEAASGNLRSLGVIVTQRDEISAEQIILMINQALALVG